MTATILKALASPSKVVSHLTKRSRGAVLSLNIERSRIGLAVVSRDENDETLAREATPLTPICTRTRRLSPECTEQLARIVQEYDIDAFIVSWPLQGDTGKMGAPCGRVLFTLESIMATSNNIFTPDRPVCLWDSLHASAEETEDDWGRDSKYARISHNKKELASEKRYTQDERIVATQIWDDFCRTHMPSIYRRKVKEIPSTAAWNLVADWKNCPSFLQAAA